MENPVDSFTIVKLSGVPLDLLRNLSLPYFNITDHTSLMVLQPNFEALRFKADTHRQVKSDHQPEILNLIFDGQHILQGNSGLSRSKTGTSIVLTGRAEFESFEKFSSLIADVGYSNLPSSSNFWLPTQSVLTYREIEVLHHVYHGRSSKKIADHLNLSSRTVELHRQNCSKKIGPITPRLLSMLFSSTALKTYLWTKSFMLGENGEKTAAMK